MRTMTNVMTNTEFENLLNSLSQQHRNLDVSKTVHLPFTKVKGKPIKICEPVDIIHCYADRCVQSLY